MKRKSTAAIAVLSGLCVLLTVLLLMQSKEDNQTGNIRSESYIGGVVCQESAEVSAQYVQAFALAKLRLDQAIEENGGTGKNLYIVTDIDATLIDDSPYLAGVLTSEENGKKAGGSSWRIDDWSGYYAAIATEAMQPTAGAQEFVSYARSQGVKIFFITNRPYYELDLTVKQLKRFGFIDEETCAAYSGLEQLQKYHTYEETEALHAFREKVNADGRFELEDGYFTRKGDYMIQAEGLAFSGDKAQRRANVAKAIGPEGRVVLYLGDSINDMISTQEYRYTDYSEEASSDFAKKKGNDARTEAVTKDCWKDKWGTEFIVMPNAAYGDWQGATWHGQAASEEGEIEAIRQQLEGHSYRNYETWYTGPSPVGENIQ